MRWQKPACTWEHHVFFVAGISKLVRKVHFTYPSGICLYTMKPTKYVQASVSTNLISEATFRARTSDWRTAHCSQPATRPQPLSHLIIINKVVLSCGVLLTKRYHRNGEEFICVRVEDVYVWVCLQQQNLYTNLHCNNELPGCVSPVRVCSIKEFYWTFSNDI